VDIRTDFTRYHFYTYGSHLGPVDASSLPFLDRESPPPSPLLAKPSTIGRRCELTY
jgi:hypothetical protein